MTTPPYIILLSQESLQTLESYKKSIQRKETKPGKYLEGEIKNRFAMFSSSEKEKRFEVFLNEQFLELILLTKKPMCFAEVEIKGGGRDWNDEELKILGDISVAMAVEVYDNGVWSSKSKAFKEHKPPMQAHLIFTPGPLLRGDSFIGPTPDLRAVLNTDTGCIDQEKYTELLERRLLPAFIYASEHASSVDKKALVVLPGLGCGAFAGKFTGKMGEHLNKALQSILQQHGQNLPNISCVRYDPFQESTDAEMLFHGIKYRVRRNAGPLGKPQLSAVNEFEEVDGEFQNCSLYKVVAWDHVSMPGNDYFIGTRATDDGVSAAATNSMRMLTGAQGCYKRGRYLPPEGLSSWLEYVEEKGIKLIAWCNIKVALPTGKLINISDSEVEKH